MQHGREAMPVSILSPLLPCYYCFSSLASPPQTKKGDEMKWITCLLFFSTITYGAIVEDLFEIETPQGTVQYAITYDSDNPGNAPGVLIVPGGGPCDRDAYRDGVSVLREQANHLAEAGYVVLRYGKGGVAVDEEGNVTVDYPKYNTNTPKIYTKLGRKFLKKLRKQPLTDPNRIAIHGKSEGSITGPLIALADGNVQALMLFTPVGKNFFETAFSFIVDFSLDFVWEHMDTDGSFTIDTNEYFPIPHEMLPPFPFEYFDKDFNGEITANEFRSKLVYFTYLALDAMDDEPSRRWMDDEWERPNFKNVIQFPNPILIVGAELDRIVPISDAMLIHDALIFEGRTNIQLSIIPGVGHGFFEPSGQWGEITGAGAYTLELYDIMIPWLDSNL